MRGGGIDPPATRAHLEMITERGESGGDAPSRATAGGREPTSTHGAGHRAATG